MAKTFLQNVDFCGFLNLKKKVVSMGWNFFPFFDRRIYELSNKKKFIKNNGYTFVFRALKLRTLINLWLKDLFYVDELDL